MLTISQPGEHLDRQPRWKPQEVRTQKRIMSEKQDTDSIRISQVLAGALAAITAAVLGSTMGVAGTVIGAGLASVVSTVGGAIYLRSIQRTRQSVRTVRAKVVGRNGTTSVLLADLPEEEKDEPTEEPEETQPPAERRLRWPVLVAGSVLAFALGMLVITGVEWIRGEPLSGGSGTTVGDVFRPPAHQQQDNDGAPVTSSTTPPPTSTGPTSTTTTPPPTSSSTTSPTTTTTTGSSTTTTTTTTGEAPTTTTTPPPG